MKWHSLHLFIHHFGYVDKFICDILPTFLHNHGHLFKKYFYIRYWVGGPHIRFRYQLAHEGDQDRIKTTLQQLLTDFVNSNEIDCVQPDSFYSDKLLEFEGVQDIYWCDHGTLMEMDYIPEYERYGGEGVMTFTENLFYKSSQLTLLLNEKLTFQKRIFSGFDLAALLLKEFSLPLPAFEYYVKMWTKMKAEDSYQLISKKELFERRYVNLTTNEKFRRFYDGYITEFLKVFAHIRTQSPEKNLNILLSHIHMTNNRLGIFPAVEYEIAYILKEIIESGKEVALHDH